MERILSTNDAQWELQKIARENKLALFVGSGISVPSPSNLPLWSGLIMDFIDFCDKSAARYSQVFKKELLRDASKCFPDYPVETISALEDAIKNEKTGKLVPEFRRWFMRKFTTSSFNDLHEKIIHTNFKQIVTTNYDNLLEEANTHFNLPWKSFTYKDVNEIAAAIYDENPSIIHIHGIWDQIKDDEIILTSLDYQKIARDNPGFRCVLQSLFIRYSVLFVGYGGHDPHFQDFMEELNHHLKWKETLKTPNYYVVLKKNRINKIIEYDKFRLSMNIIEIDDYGEISTFLEELKNACPRQYNV